MNVIFYIQATDKTQEWIYEVTKMAPEKADTEIFGSIRSLSRRLRRPSDDFAIAVLAAVDREDLANIISIRSLFLEIPVILILPDREADTTAMGYTLIPRFLTYTDGNPVEVGAVLEKMLQNHKKKNLWINGK